MQGGADAGNHRVPLHAGWEDIGLGPLQLGRVGPYLFYGIRSIMLRL